MSKLDDYTGRTFGRLICLKKSGYDRQGRTMWLCRCECGNEKVVMWSSLDTGNTQSCGCLAKERRKLARSTHSYSVDENGKSPRLYSIWKNMKQRCFNPNAEKFGNYGGAGITVCQEWLDYMPFHNWATQNGYQDNLTLDRINRKGNYEPSNCRWATYSEQNLNTSQNRIVEYNGKKKTMREWSDELNIKYSTLRARFDQYGWTAEKAFNTPVRKRRVN